MKKFNSVLVCIALLIVAATIIPFTPNGLGQNEIAIKFALFPLVILLIAIIGVVGKDKKVEGKKGFYCAALLLSSYIAAAFANVFFFILRSSVDYVLLAFTFVGSLIFTIFALSLPKFEHRKALFMPLAITFVVIGTACFLFADKSVGTDASKFSTLALICSGSLALLTTILYMVEYFIMTKKLTDTRMERDVVLYQEIMDDNLRDIYDYSKNELQNRGAIFEETKVEVVKEIPVEKIVDREIIKEVPVDRVVEKEVEVVKEVPIPQYVEKEVIKEIPVIKEVEVVKEVPVVKEVVKEVEKVVEVIKEVPVVKEVEKVVVREIPVEKVVEVVKEVPVDKVVQVVKEIPVEKIVEVEKKKKTTTVKEKKLVEPTPSQLAIKAEKMFDDVKIVYGKDENNYKVMLNKKVIMIVSGSITGYKVTFQRKPISATKLLVKYPAICQKATTPQGDQWFKITNNGSVEENDLYDLIKFSHKYTVDEEAQIALKKEKEKEKERLAKEKAKAAEEKAKQKAIEAEERAKQKAIEAEEKAKQKAIEAEEKAKAREEARKLAAEEKAKQKAIEAEERAKAREEAKRLAAEEKARQKELAKQEVVEAVPASVEASDSNVVHTVTTTTITQTVETIEATNSDVQMEAIKAAVREALAEHEAEKENK